MGIRCFRNYAARWTEDYDSVIHRWREKLEFSAVTMTAERLLSAEVWGFAP